MAEKKQRAEYRNKIRTRKMIRETFAELIEEKQDISSLSVKELVERSGISKSTFYMHYRDIYAVAEEFEDELFNLVNETVDGYIKSNNPYDIGTFALQAINALGENEALYRKLASSTLTDSFVEKLKKLFLNKIKNIKFKGFSTDPVIRRVELDLIANGIIYTFVDYFKSNERLGLESMDEISKIISELTAALKKFDA
jgi:AcrR family transcriptional regulator